MYESPLPADDPLATFRVQCPVCRNNIWAGHVPPPEEGDELLAQHSCPGPADTDAEVPDATPNGMPVESPHAIEVASGEVFVVDGP